LQHSRLALPGRALYIRQLFMTNDDDARLRKLKLRAWRRGFREADLILGPFADKHVSEFTPTELDWFEILLDQPDQDVYAWIVGTLPTPADFDGEIMNRIKAFRFEVHAARGDDRGG
jgi:antitoxin CptB